MFLIRTAKYLLFAVHALAPNPYPPQAVGKTNSHPSHDRTDRERYWAILYRYFK